MTNVDIEKILFDVHNVTSIDVCKSNTTQVFQPNLSFPFDHGSVELTDTINENGEWSQLFDIIQYWQNIYLAIIFCALIVITIIGNTLVILAIKTTRRLKTVTNCFVMSLAVADLLVGIFVMPPAVAVHIKGLWQLGWILCDIWIALDVLLCTASILSLCAISVDRYLAVTQPLAYSKKRRSKRLAFVMILIVWSSALAITCPPMFGWYEPRRNLSNCRYSQNEGYVIFSAMGSFFVPMIVMVYVYGRISCVVASRHNKMTDINIHNQKYRRSTVSQTTADIDVKFYEKNITKNQTKLSTDRASTIPIVANEHHEVVCLDQNNLITRSSCIEMQTFTMLAQGKERQSFITTGISNFTIDQYTSNNFQRQSKRLIIDTNHSFFTRNTWVHHRRPLYNRISSFKKENKTTKTLSMVIGGFIVCWLPFFIYYLITPFLTMEQQQISRNLSKELTWLGWLNSAINPFIYAFYSVDFRTAFWRLTFGQFFRDSLKAKSTRR